MKSDELIREIIRSTILEEAFLHIWKPYKWGANGPDSFDCSGFVIYLLERSGIWTFGDDSAQGIFNRYRKFPAKPGTKAGLVFFGPSETEVSHVAVTINDLAIIGAHGGQIRKVDVVPHDYREKEAGENDLIGYADPVLSFI